MYNLHLSMSDIKLKFDIGQQLYFACLLPKYDWFEKKFSISKILKPTLTTIIKNTIMHDSITSENRFLLNKIKFPNVARKFVLKITLENGYKFRADIFENNTKNIIIIYENHIAVGKTFEDVESDFYRMVISLKASINMDSSINIINDESFKIFKQLYLIASDIYPEEVIKSHNTIKK